MFICTVCSDFIYLAHPRVLIERLYISGFLIHIPYWICRNTISIADNNFRPIRIILLRGRKMRCSCRFILFSYWATFHGLKYGFRDLSQKYFNDWKWFPIELNANPCLINSSSFFSKNVYSDFRRTINRC
jgi:hypothetical protein